MEWQRIYRKMSAYLAFGTLALSIVVVAAQLRGLIPISSAVRSISIAPATALVFGTTAIALVLSLQAGARRRAASRAIAMCSAGLALSSGWSNRIGLARPAVATIVALVLIDAAIALFDRRVRGRFISSTLAIVCGLLGLVGAAGYVYGAPALYRFHEHEWGMALVTAITLVGLSIGVLLARPERAPISALAGNGAGARTLRRLLPAAFAVPLIGVAFTAAARARPDEIQPMAGLLAVAGFVAAIALLFYVARLLEREELAEARLARLVESAAAPIIDTDVDGTVIGWNGAAERVYGFRAGEILGRSVFVVVPRDNRERIARLRAEVVRTRSQRTFEGARTRADGGEFYASTTLSPILGDRGEVIGISAVSYDLTERRLAERALERAIDRERRFADALRRGNDAARAVSASLVDIDRLGLSGVAREIAAQARAMTSASRTAIGLDAGVDGVPAIWIELDETGSTVVEPRAPNFSRLREERPDFGDALVTDICFRGAVLGKLILKPAPAGASVEEMNVLSQIVADRAAAAIEVARAHERDARARAWIEAVVDQMPSPVALVDAETGRIRRNKAALALTLLPTGERDSLGNPIVADLRTPAGVRIPPGQRPLERIIRRRETIHDEEIWAHVTEGEDVPLLVDGAPVYDSAGRLIGGVLVSRDLTAQKQLERLRSE